MPAWGYSLRLLWILLATAIPVAAIAEQIPTDWDLYMLKLVNAARTNPAAENQLRGTNYTNPSVSPLAYNTLVGEAAQNHTHWMSLNANNPAIQNPSAGSSPDSFAHRETYNGQSSGAPAVDTPGYTGASVGDRLSHVGYSNSSWGENIIWGSFPSTINANRILENHIIWWKSSGHRDNLMSPNFTTFGNYQLSDFDHWATQNFSRPGGTRTHLFGVLYDDLNGSGKWNPPTVTSGASEGLGNVDYRVYQSGTSTQVGSDTTLDNGAFSFRTGNGVYDIQFLLAGDDRWVRGLTINGTNLDVGDIEAAAPALLAGDYNDDGRVDAADYAEWRDNLGGAATTLDNNVDGGPIGAAHYATWKANFGSTSGASLAGLTSAAVPEPASLVWLALVALPIAWMRLNNHDR